MAAKAGSNISINKTHDALLEALRNPSNQTAGHVLKLKKVAVFIDLRVTVLFSETVDERTNSFFHFRQSVCIPSNPGSFKSFYQQVDCCRVSQFKCFSCLKTCVFK